MRSSSELETYEREAARRVGPGAARELRSELETHLTADVIRRIEEGAHEEMAWTEALAALGDLRVAARAERPPHWRFGRILLFIAPALASLAWYLPQWVVIRNGALPEWVPSALGLAFFVATPLGTALVRRPVFGAILLGAVAHGLLVGGGMALARGSTRLPVSRFIVEASAGMVVFGLVATLALHLVAHLLIFGLPSLRLRAEVVPHA